MSALKSLSARSVRTVRWTMAWNCTLTVNGLTTSRAEVSERRCECVYMVMQLHDEKSSMKDLLPWNYRRGKTPDPVNMRSPTTMLIYLPWAVMLTTRFWKNLFQIPTLSRLQDLRHSLSVMERDCTPNAMARYLCIMWTASLCRTAKLGQGAAETPSVP